MNGDKPIRGIKFDGTGAGRGSAGNPRRKPRILFVCTANAARSQMAEGLLRAKYGDRYEAFSAGTASRRSAPGQSGSCRRSGSTSRATAPRPLLTFQGSGSIVPSPSATTPTRHAPLSRVQKKQFTGDSPIPTCCRGLRKKSSRDTGQCGTRSPYGSTSCSAHPARTTRLMTCHRKDSRDSSEGQ